MQESLDKALEKLKEGYQSLIKIDCSKEESIYDLLYKTRFTEQIKFMVVIMLRKK